MADTQSVDLYDETGKNCSEFGGAQNLSTTGLADAYFGGDGTLGSPTRPWTPELVNSVEFAVGAYGTIGGGYDEWNMNIDVVEVEVFYETPSGGGSQRRLFARRSVPPEIPPALPLGVVTGV